MRLLSYAYKRPLLYADFTHIIHLESVIARRSETESPDKNGVPLVWTSNEFGQQGKQGRRQELVRQHPNVRTLESQYCRHWPLESRPIGQSVKAQGIHWIHAKPHHHHSYRSASCQAQPQSQGVATSTSVSGITIIKVRDQREHGLVHLRYPRHRTLDVLRIDRAGKGWRAYAGGMISRKITF